MLRRLLAVIVTALSAATLTAALPAGPADAASYCIFTPPAKITIFKTETVAPATINGACRPNGYGYWATPGDEYYAEALFSPQDGAVIDVPDQLSVYGRQPWERYGAGTDAASCFDSARSKRVKSAASSTARVQGCDDAAQNVPYSDIRLGGYASLAASRSGSKITFLAGSGGWSPFSHKLVARPNIAGEIQTQFADGTWHRVGNPIRTTSNAKAQVSFTIPATRTFRFAIYSTASYRERASMPITR